MLVETHTWLCQFHNLDECQNQDIIERLNHHSLIVYVNWYGGLSLQANAMRALIAHWTPNDLSIGKYFTDALGGFIGVARHYKGCLLQFTSAVADFTSFWQVWTFFELVKNVQRSVHISSNTYSSPTPNRIYTYHTIIMPHAHKYVSSSNIYCTLPVMFVQQKERSSRKLVLQNFHITKWIEQQPKV